MKRLIKVLFLVIIMIAFLAYMDIMGFKLFSQMELTLEEHTSVGPVYMKFFWTFAIALGIVVAITYYLITKDISESIAIIFSYLLMVWSGLEDVIFYALKGIPIPETLPWLNNNELISRITTLLGETTVTRTTLLISVTLAAIIAYYTVMWLQEKDKILGISV